MVKVYALSKRKVSDKKEDTDAGIFQKNLGTDKP